MRMYHAVKCSKLIAVCRVSCKIDKHVLWLHVLRKASCKLVLWRNRTPLLCKCFLLMCQRHRSAVLFGEISAKVLVKVSSRSVTKVMSASIPRSRKKALRFFNARCNFRMFNLSWNSKRGWMFCLLPPHQWYATANTIAVCYYAASNNQIRPLLNRMHISFADSKTINRRLTWFNRMWDGSNSKAVKQCVKRTSPKRNLARHVRRML